MNSNYRMDGSTYLGGRIAVIGVMVSLSLFAPAVLAATVKLSGSGVDFYYDDSQQGLVHFGTPEISDSGDTLLFLPQDFNAMSVDGVGVHTGSPTDAVNASFTFRAVLHDGVALDSIGGRELGGYRLKGEGFVDYNSSLSVMDTASIFNSTLGLFESADDFTIADANYHSWSAISSIDLTAENWVGVGDILVTLSSNLSAGSQGVGDSAFIEKTPTMQGINLALSSDPSSKPSYSKGKKKKKGQDNNPWVYAESAIVLAPAAVPLPASAWLFGSGLLAVLGFMRNK